MNARLVLIAFAACWLMLIVVHPCEASPTFSEKDCMFSQWMEWTPCWATCGSDDVIQYRHRTIDVNVMLNRSYDTSQCEDFIHEKRPCDVPPCPNDCILSPWSHWSPCDCKINQMERTRTVLRQAASGGSPCSKHVHDVLACNGTEWDCTQDCQHGEWLSWSDCTVTCGQGSKVRQRRVLTSAINGGQPCPQLRQMGDCIMDPCPIGDGGGAADICSNTTGYLRDPVNACSEFFVNCASGKIQWLLCPDKLRFNGVNQCDYPENIPQCHSTRSGANSSSTFNFSLKILMAIIVITFVSF